MRPARRTRGMRGNTRSREFGPVELEGSFSGVQRVMCPLWTIGPPVGAPSATDPSPLCEGASLSAPRKQRGRRQAIADRFPDAQALVPLGRALGAAEGADLELAG